MRISDWSSDVCSSDLHRPHPSAALGARRQGLASAAYGSIASASIIAIPVVDGQQKSLHQAGPFVVSIERRSEERREGKSVSVRVDLGGRRIIKKTKKTHAPQTTSQHSHTQHTT